MYNGCIVGFNKVLRSSMIIGRGNPCENDAIEFKAAKFWPLGAKPREIQLGKQQKCI